MVKIFAKIEWKDTDTVQAETPLSFSLDIALDRSSVISSATASNMSRQTAMLSSLNRLVGHAAPAAALAFATTLTTTACDNETVSSAAAAPAAAAAAAASSTGPRLAPTKAEPGVRQRRTKRCQSIFPAVRRICVGDCDDAVRNARPQVLPIQPRLL